MDWMDGRRYYMSSDVVLSSDAAMPRGKKEKVESLTQGPFGTVSRNLPTLP